MVGMGGWLKSGVPDDDQRFVLSYRRAYVRMGEGRFTQRRKMQAQAQAQAKAKVKAGSGDVMLWWSHGGRGGWDTRTRTAA
jgi:hypothetical protein